MKIFALITVALALALAGPPSVVEIPMRDGVRLSTNVYLPAVPGRHSAVLVRTPYGKGKKLLPGYQLFVDRGFAFLVQDVRGRYDSEGIFRPPVQEDGDGGDTLRWIARQPWSNGAVAMIGGSYLGIAQWRAALSGNPHLRAISPANSGSDEYRDRFYSPGGALKLGHRLEWIAENLTLPTHTRPSFSDMVRHLPLRTADEFITGQRIRFYQDALDHPSYDDYWKARSTRERLRDVSVPAFIVSGWYDNYAESDLETFEILNRQSGAHSILIGPWPHNMSIPFPGVSFGPGSGAPIRRLQLKWIEHWINGPQPVPDFPQAPVRLFIMGANQWRDEQEWPLARTRQTPFYLSEGGRLTTDPRRNRQDQYVYDPRHPVPTRGGAVCCNPQVFPWGPQDQRSVEARKDVLVYSSPPLKREVEVTGEIRVILHVSTSAPDTDFTAKLVDVFPNGHARNLCDGILRLRYRKGLRAPEFATPGQIYAIQIPAGVTSNVFKAGHRIRLEISSSNFPRFDRNPNTGRPIADETELRPARQTVYYGVKYPSHVLLPVIP